MPVQKCRRLGDTRHKASPLPLWARNRQGEENATCDRGKTRHGTTVHQQKCPQPLRPIPETPRASRYKGSLDLRRRDSSRLDKKPGRLAAPETRSISRFDRECFLERNQERAHRPARLRRRSRSVEKGPK